MGKRLSWLVEECVWGLLFVAFAGSVALSVFVLYAALVLRSRAAACVAAAYAAWMLWDGRTPWRGGRPASRRYGATALAWLHAHARRYFSVTLVADAHAPRTLLDAARAPSSVSVVQDSLLPLGATLEHEVASGILRDATHLPNAETPCIVCFHPHGVWPFGMLGAFLFGAADALLQSRCAVLTLGVQFAVPLWREVCLSAGLAVADAATMASLLSRGTSVVIALGGASEATLARPGVMEVVLRRRRGVFRIALQTGAALRPALSLHEHDLYWQARWAWLRPLQRLSMRLTGLPFPMVFWARRSLFGLVPGRGAALPIVLGAPIRPERVVPHPSDAEIADLARRYTAALVDLHARHSRGSSVLVVS